MNPDYFILSNLCTHNHINTKRKAGNSTYFYRNGNQYLITRENNYIYGKTLDNKIKMYFENNGSMSFCISEALYEKHSLDVKFIKYLTKYSQHDIGFEDPRCVTWNNKNYILMNRRNPSNFHNVQMHLGIIDENFNYTSDKILHPNTGIEKNWQPILDKPGLCIYHHNPLKIINVFNNSIVSSNKTTLDFCGSSQIIRISPQSYLGIAHKRTTDFRYLHYFIEYDNNFNIKHISNPFSFFGAYIEFVTHMESHDNIIKILVSIHDQLLYEFNIELNCVQHILLTPPTNNNFNNNIFTKLYTDAINSNNIFAAIGIATFSHDSDVLYDAVEKNHNTRFLRENDQHEIQPILIRNSL